MSDPPPCSANFEGSVGSRPEVGTDLSRRNRNLRREPESSYPYSEARVRKRNTSVDLWISVGGRIKELQDSIPKKRINLRSVRCVSER